MKHFAALLSAATAPNPGEQQKHLSARLFEALSKSRLNLWNVRDDIAQVNRRALVGIATYSIYDLRLLDALNELPLEPATDRVDVFDVLKCQTAEDFEKFIPNVGKVFQTPVVGIWKNGVIEEKCSGHNARELLSQIYAIDRNRLL